MSKYCMIENAFNNKEEINEAINVLYQRDLLQVPILLKVTVAGSGKMKEKVIKSLFLSISLI